MIALYERQIALLYDALMRHGLNSEHFAAMLNGLFKLWKENRP